MNCLYTNSISAEFLLQYLSVCTILLVSVLGIARALLVQHLKSVAFNRNFFLLGVAFAIHMSTVFLNAQFQNDNQLRYTVESIEYDNQITPVTHWNPPKPKRIMPPEVKEAKIEKLYFKPIITQTTLQKPFLDLNISSEEAIELPTSNASSTESAPLPIPEEPGEELVMIPERMPRFPGCEDITKTTKEREDCAKRLLLKYMHENIKYPSVAKDNIIEGTVVIQFVVSKTGAINDVKIVRDIGGGCGQEAARVVKSMNNFDTLWTPGKQRGRAVNVLFTLPVNFKLGN